MNTHSTYRITVEIEGKEEEEEEKETETETKEEAKEKKKEKKKNNKQNINKDNNNNNNEEHIVQLTVTRQVRSRTFPSPCNSILCMLMCFVYRQCWTRLAERGVIHCYHVSTLLLLDEHSLPLYSGFFPFSFLPLYIFLLMGRVDILSSSSSFSAL